MRKEDLENLMMVVTANNEKYLVVDGWLIGEEHEIIIKDFNDDLTCGHEEGRIDKVYDKIWRLSDIEELEQYGELLWERQWFPNRGEEYYFPYIFNSGVGCKHWYNNEIDNYRLDLGIVYKTKKEAMEHGKRIAEMIKAEKNKEK